MMPDRRDLFVDGEFVSHSGENLSFKIECDALTDGDIEALAAEVARRFRFSKVYGVPRGGQRLAEALAKYKGTGAMGGPLLIVDDVLTTGSSMEEARRLSGVPLANGVVIFARGPCPEWVTALFKLWW